MWMILRWLVVFSDSRWLFWPSNTFHSPSCYWIPLYLLGTLLDTWHTSVNQIEKTLALANIHYKGGDTPGEVGMQLLLWVAPGNWRHVWYYDGMNCFYILVVKWCWCLIDTITLFDSFHYRLHGNYFSSHYCNSLLIWYHLTLSWLKLTMKIKSIKEFIIQCWFCTK